MKISSAGLSGPAHFTQCAQRRSAGLVCLRVALVAVLLFLHPAAHAVSAGDLDTTFNNDGIALTDVGGRFDIGEAIAVQDDGKIVVAGSSRVGVNTVIAVVRYNPDGTLDTDFDFDGIVTTPLLGQDDAAFGVAIQDDGKILVGGRTWNGADFDFALLRYEEDGTLDDTFGASGIVTTDFAPGSNDQAFALVLQDDGKIVLAGSTGSVLLSAFALARYEDDGTLDAGFGTGGLVTTDLAGPDSALAVALQPDNRIVAAGFSFNGVDDDIAIVRYFPDGRVDTAFGTNGVITVGFTATDERATGITVQPNSRIVASGFSNVNGDFDFLLLRFIADGTPDGSFGTAGVVTTDLQGADDRAQALVLQSDNKIVAVGSTSSLRAGNVFDDDFGVVRYLSDGALDSTFGNDGVVVTTIGTLGDLALAVTLQADGRILVAGVSDIGPDTDIAVARYRDVPGAQAAITSDRSGGGGCATATGTGAGDYSLLLLLGILLLIFRWNARQLRASPIRRRRRNAQKRK